MAVSTTKVSRNGQVVIPKLLRDRLGLRPGDSLVASDVEGRLVLSPVRGEALRRELADALQAFDRALQGREFSEEEAVRMVRRGRRRRGSHPRGAGHDRAR